MLQRREVVSKINQGRGDALMVTGLGSSSYDLHAAGDDDRNFYLWGAMGGAAMTGLGVAMAQPDKHIIVLTGDGEMLMGIGALATIGVQQPKNLSIIVLDNGHYGETGMQASHTQFGVDLPGIASASGLPVTMSVTNEAELNKLIEAITAQQQGKDGAIFASVKVAPESPERSLPIVDGVEIKNRFRRTLGLQPL
ncbi:MAG: thiamine pyrophosphate-dependent enzyme [Candidatus Puniceispirillaceae bacterium]